MQVRCPRDRWTPSRTFPRVDNYVVVHLPLGDSSNDEHRFLMLNGLGAKCSLTLEGPGTIEAWLIDSDPSGNNGTALE